MKVLTLALFVGVFTTACLQPAGTLFRATALQPDGAYPMPVTLGDETGFVVAIESAPGDYGDGDLPHVQSDPEDPNAVIVSWGTGACDDDTAASFKGAAAGYRLDLDVNEGFPVACSAQLLIRGLRIRFSTPIPADTIGVFGGL